MPTSSRNILAGIVLIAVGAVLGWGVAQWHGAKAGGDTHTTGVETERKVLYWYDPMVPTQKFDRPGKSPFMDMALVPKYADEIADGGVSVPARTIQSLGLRTVQVVERAVGSDVDAVGSVLLNDRDVGVVQARAAGFVERVYARAAGDVVAAGAPLVDLLLPEWVAAQREFLAVRALKDEALTAAARQRLLLLGMPRALVEEVERTGAPQGVYTVTAPLAGVVTELTVRQGMTVSSGTTLARINGLGTVWIEAAVPEAQSGALQVGQAAQVRLAAFPGETLQARIVSILPQADSDTRTVRVRLELANSGQRLKAGMSGQITLRGDARPALLVPSDAVIRTGKRALVYVVDGPGTFHPVEVQVGAEIGDELVLRQGLRAGQEVVASAQFLIDSEASLRGVVPMGIGAASSATHAHGAFTARGVIEEVSPTELTLTHDPIPALKWPTMTMSFKLSDPRLSAGLAPKQIVRFTFSKQGDEYVIGTIEKLQP